MVLQLRNQIINYQQPLECFFILKLVEEQSRHCSFTLLPLGVPSSIYQIEGTVQVLRPISTVCLQFHHSICNFMQKFKESRRDYKPSLPRGYAKPKGKIKPLNICYPYLVDLPRAAIRGCSIRSSSLQSLSLSGPALSQTPLSSSCSLSVAPIEHQSTQALRSHGAGISPLCKQRRTPPRL